MAEHRVLVTGAAGFIGSHVADECLDLGMSVLATDDLSGGYCENVPSAADWVKGDLRDAEFVASLWSEGPFDFVYHLGAYAAEGLSHFIRAYNYRNNVEASNQQPGAPRRQALRVHELDRRLRRRTAADERGDGPPARFGPTTSTGSARTSPTSTAT